MAAHGIPPPTPLSLIVCERVIVDAVTGQHSLIGTMPHVQASGFPVALPQMAVFAEFTNGRGPTALTLRIADVNEEREPVFAASVSIPMDDPLMVGCLVMGLANLVFPSAGEYRVQVLCGTILLTERKLMLMPMNPPTQPPTPTPDSA